MNERVKTALALKPADSALEPIQPAATPPYYMSYAAEEGNQLRDYWRSIRKRLWLVIGLTVIASVLTGVVMIRLPNVYEARARVRVDLENTSPMFGAFKNNSVVVNNPTNDPAYFN